MRLSNADLGAVATAAIVVFAASVGAQQDDPINDFCRRFGHEAAVINDRLYINGGHLNFENNPKNFTNTRLLYHNLSTTEYNGEDVGMPILVTSPSKLAEVPSLVGGTLWADQSNGRLYQFGGQWSESETPEGRFRLYSYDVYEDRWSTQDPDRAISRLSYGAGTSVEHLGLGYYMGGWMNERTDRNWVGRRVASNKLLTYDMVNNKWTNNTGPSDQEGRAEGALFYVPFSDNGMLAYFGGVRVNRLGEEKPGSMGTIDIYDLAGNKWYTQNATGDIPEPRHRFCGGVATANDGSSSNIYIYGGLGFGANATGYDDAYILSIPTFTWIKIYPAPGIVRKEGDAYPKFDMSCSVVKGSQLVIIGGQYSRDLEVKTCDVPKAWGAHNLVMSKVDTGTSAAYWGLFDPKRDSYTIPDDIIKVIGGDAHGNAQVKAPDPKFDAADLDVLFRRTVTVKPRKPTRTAPASHTSSTEVSTDAVSDDPGVFSTPGKRAAILVPVICGIAILAGLAFFLVRRYRRKNTAAAAQSQSDAPPPQYKQEAIDGHMDESSTYHHHQQPGWGHLPQPTPNPAEHQYQDSFPTGPYSDYSNSVPRPASPPPAELGATCIQGTPSGQPGPPVDSPPVMVGHFPPPLREGLMEAQNPVLGPEMKDRGGANRFSENL